MNALLRSVLDSAKGLNAAKWLLLGSLVGVVCGVAGIGFYMATDIGAHLVLTGLGGYVPDLPAGEVHLLDHRGDEHSLAWWWIIVALVVGGLVSGALVQLASKARGAGTEHVVDAFHNHNGHIALRTTVVKFLASIATLASGGSAGREGPIAQVGAGLASWCGARFQLSSREQRILIAAGMAGGVAAIFRAPLAAALFAAEVMYSDPEVEADVLIPSFISAIVAFVVFGLLQGVVFPPDQLQIVTSLFLAPDLSFASGDALHLVGYLLIALVVVMAARAQIAASRRTQPLFDTMPVPVWMRPAVGGLIAGIIAVLLLHVSWWTGLVDNGMTPVLATLGAGYGIIQQAMDGFGEHIGSGVALLLIVAIGKMITTTCTVGSGGSGGKFGPSIVMGGCLGGAVGLALEGTMIAPPVAACVIMGMAGFFAASYKTPIAALLMVSEMSGSYGLLLPAMWVCALGYLLSGRQGLVAHQVRSPIDSRAHRGHFFNDILAGIKVSAVFDPQARPVETLKPESSIDDCRELVANSHQTVYPVVNADGQLTGIFNLNDLREYLFDESLGLVAVAQDVATDDIITLSPRESLAECLRRFTIKNLEELPVVADDNADQFLGLLTRRQVIDHYNRVVDELRQMRREEGWAEPGEHSAARDATVGHKS